MASSLFSFAVNKPRVLAPPPNVIDEAMLFESVELERKLEEQLATALSKEQPDAEGEKRRCRCDRPPHPCAALHRCLWHAQTTRLC